MPRTSNETAQSIKREAKTAKSSRIASKSNNMAEQQKNSDAVKGLFPYNFADVFIYRSG